MDNVSARMNGIGSTGQSTGDRSNDDRHGKRKKTKLKFVTIIVGVVLAVLLLLSGGWFVYQSSTSANIDSDKYQALFLSNGQVYFGKLHAINGGYMKLTDIYYLQTQSSSTTSNLQDSSSKSSSDVQLIKLGSEIHGPSDEMIVSKDQILFFENLKKDGKVAESIASYLAQQKK